MTLVHLIFVTPLDDQISQRLAQAMSAYYK